MANWLARVLPSWLSRSKEGEYRPGPYLLSDGMLSAKAGAILNWWQSGYSLQPYGEGGAMVEACVSAYAQTVAMCPGDHWRKKGDGGRERVTTSSLSRIMKRPNDYQSISDFLLNLTRRLYKQGEAFAVGIRNERREITEIHFMLHGRALVAEDGSIFYQLSGNEIAERRFDLSNPIPARDVLHVRLHTPRHPLKGESPILATVLERAMAGAALNQQVAYYLNQSRPSWLLETEQNLNSEQVRALRERWEEQTTGENAGRTPILTSGLKARSAPTTAADDHLADMLKLTDQSIALAFRIPLQVLGLGGAAFASTEALMASWKASGLGFALNHIEEAFGLLFGLEGQPDEYLELDTDALMRSAFKDRIEALARGVITGIYAPDEARERVDLPAVEGGHGKMPRVQQQVVPLSYGTEMKPPDPDKTALPAPAPEPDIEDDDDAGRSFDDFTRDIDARVSALLH
jgi:HK97 family phage portal protein